MAAGVRELFVVDYPDRAPGREHAEHVVHGEVECE